MALVKLERRHRDERRMGGKLGLVDLRPGAGY